MIVNDATVRHSYLLAGSRTTEPAAVKTWKAPPSAARRGFRQQADKPDSVVG